jgi:hypothetical protein
MITISKRSAQSDKGYQNKHGIQETQISLLKLRPFGNESSLELNKGVQK